MISDKNFDFRLKNMYKLKKLRRSNYMVIHNGRTKAQEIAEKNHFAISKIKCLFNEYGDCDTYKSVKSMFLIHFW